MAALGVCRRCVLTNVDLSLPRVRESHAITRRLHGLTEQPPNSPGGAGCALCARGCTMDAGERGYCNLREGAPARSGGVRLHHLAGRPSHGLLQWYRDPLPTNCVADWVCAGHDRRGMHNLAVFYQSCTFNCLYCQNWHFRQVDPTTSPGTSARQLAGYASADTFCVCYFGGDPSSQMPHALASARLLAFAPGFVASDLPPTSRSHAREAEQAALAAGLRDVRIGNRHLLTTEQPPRRS